MKRGKNEEMEEWKVEEWKVEEWKDGRMKKKGKMFGRHDT